MSDFPESAQPFEPDWAKLAPNVRHRYCPGCKGELSRFSLAAMAMPIEQFAMGPLQAVNRSLGFSIRPFGFQNLHELQFLSFTSLCDQCTLISNWDFGVDELDEILALRVHPPFAQIAWNYSPENIARHLAEAPEWLKPNLQQLLDMVKQAAGHGEKQ